MKPGGAGINPPGSDTPGAPKPGTGPGSPGYPGAGTGMPGGADALTVAHAFSKAIVELDFEMARRLTDPESVTDERVAALIIAMEEGSFHLREDKPLVVTLSREDITWVLTRVDSEEEASEFAMEMGNHPQAGWLINGLTFSKLIAALANAAGAGGVAYAPIVADPQGGDSLVLYFEFDEGNVSARTLRQLEIIAGILKQDPARKLHINGHADAMGTDDYNENLSNARAASVRKTLIDFGVAPGQVITKAFGEAMPRRPNFNPDGTDNPGGRSQNRRAEVYLDF
jgi:outer membrane protein OmpA-like peptidoglycan-associated protein